MNRAAFAIVATIGLTCGFAHAADLTPASVKAPAPVPYSWTGIYFGANGGYAWGSQEPFNVITNRFDQLSTGISGGVFGGTIGAQVQVSYVVLGVEADIDWANIKGSTTAVPTIGGVPVAGFPVNAQTNIDWQSTARLRAGLAANNVLVYFTGGLALQEAKTSLTTPIGPVCTGISSSCNGTDRQVGAVLGGGVEYGFTPNLSGKVEFLYITAASLDISHTSEIRAGLNYRLGGF